MDEMHEAYECKIDKNSMKTTNSFYEFECRIGKKFNLTPKFALDFDYLLCVMEKEYLFCRSFEQRLMQKLK